MKYAVSNLAWEVRDDPAIRAALLDAGVDGVEIAPTKVWPEPVRVPTAEIATYRRTWTDHGVRCVALQALLFGKPELLLFADQARRDAMLAHLQVMMRIAAGLGAGILVFGAPRNRARGAMSHEAARDVAVAFFRRAGSAAREHGVVLCIEPNPEEYGCDFVTTAAEGLELVRSVDDPGFGLHLDAAAIQLGGESPDEAIGRCGSAIRHFHASEPGLRPLGARAPGTTGATRAAGTTGTAGTTGAGGAPSTDHAAMARALRAIGYRGRVSVEMRADPSGDAVAAVRRAAGFLRTAYAGS